MLVAARAVQAGTLPEARGVTAREALAAELPEGAMRDTPETRIEFIGAMVRRTLSQGDVLPFDGVLRPGENGFLAAVLAPGMRARHRRRRCRLRHRRADLARRPCRRHPDPGLRRADAAPARRVAGETVLTAARVIAVDRHLVQGMQPGQVGDCLRETNRTVTLEVTAGAGRRASRSRPGSAASRSRCAPPARRSRNVSTSARSGAAMSAVPSRRLA